MLLNHLGPSLPCARSTSLTGSDDSPASGAPSCISSQLFASNLSGRVGTQVALSERSVMFHRGLHFHPFFRVAGANGHHPRTISDSTIYNTGPPSSSSILALDQQPHLRFPSSLLAALHPLETGGLADISLSDIWPPYRQTRERQTVGLRRGGADSDDKEIGPRSTAMIPSVA